MKTAATLKALLTQAALAAVCFLAGALGLRLAVVHPSVTSVAPAAGIALAACLILGLRVWPGVFAGTLLAHLGGGSGLAASLGIAAGSTLEAVLGAWLVERWAQGRRAFDGPKHALLFALLAGVLSPVVGAALGGLSLVLAQRAAWSGLGSIAFTWWLGDMGGNLVVAPLLLLWSAPLSERSDERRAVERLALLAIAVLVGEVALGSLPAFGAHWPLTFVCMPVFLWAAFRFGRRGAALVVAVEYAIAVEAAMHGLGAFARPSRIESVLLLQAFAAVAAVTTLMTAALVAERRRAEVRLTLLASHDALTGLGNYRLLIEVLEREIQRSNRTGRPFAVLFLDLDRLKTINDVHGHLVGSRALWRVAEAMRLSCRAIDTAARYGGDEFALVLPESDEAAARRLAQRITELLAADAEQPPVTVSSGFAVFPRDGTGVEALLAVADRAQYAVKERHSGGRKGPRGVVRPRRGAPDPGSRAPES